MEDEIVYWKCNGVLAKYERPCPQKLMFINQTYAHSKGFDVEQLKRSIDIKCPRCGKINGGNNA
jgi:hypothetical protein